MRIEDNKTSTHFFTNGTGSVRITVVAERCLRAVFKKSGVPNAHTHRFRQAMAPEIFTNAARCAAWWTCSASQR